MCAERHSKPNDFRVKVRSADLDAPTLMDQISAELLDHLIACRTCSVIFSAQEHSLGEAGCVEGRRISSQSRLKWQERRATLALQHLTEQTVDDYLFDRLSCDERQPLAELSHFSVFEAANHFRISEGYRKVFTTEGAVRRRPKWPFGKL